jgi:alcohol dehydrogenase class IV
MNKNVFEFPICYSSVIGKVAIGWGAYETVADECKMAGIKKALVTTTGLKKTGIVDEVTHILTSNGIATEIFNKVTPNPKDYEVMAAYEVFKNTGCDGVVSIGGGSSHDCGKGVRAVAANDGKDVLEMFVYVDPPWMETIKNHKPVNIPQIAVNTTAGTGAESTIGAAIINSKAPAKGLVILPGLGPTTALIDPLLVRQMPQDVAASTGFDALCHAFESFIARTRSQYNWGIQYRAMKLVAENLREFTYNRMNHTACESMCWAENMASVGIGFSGGVGLVHGLGHGLTVLFGVPHGLASAVVTIPIERYNQSACLEKFAEMAEAMGADTRGLNTVQASDKWFDEMERLLADLNITTGHLKEQFGLQEKDFDHIVKWQYERDFCREGNPRDYNYDDCIQLLKSML